MKTRNLILVASMASVSLVLSACGGGAGGDSAPANAIAHAGSDQYIARSASVALDGSASTDPDGDTLSYKWTQIAGADVTNGSGNLTGINPGFIAPDAPGTLSFELRVNDGHGDSAPDVVQVNVLGDVVHEVGVMDPAQRLTANHAYPITQDFLTRKFNDAFTLILNSPDDSASLAIDGTVTVPIPIPDVPPGLFNGGISVAKNLTITTVKEATATYYDVSIERDAGINFGIGVPDLPPGVEVGATATTSFSTSEVFRFNSPADAAKGMMNYFILKGLWKEMNKLNAVGIDATDVASIATRIKDYISAQTGFDFSLTITRDQLNTLLNGATLAVKSGQLAVSTAQKALGVANGALTIAQSGVASAKSAVDSKQKDVDIAQANYDNCTFLDCAPKLAVLVTEQGLLKTAQTVLDAAKKTLSLAQADVAKATSALAKAQSDLTIAQQNVNTYQSQLAALPDSTSIDVFGLALNKILSGLNVISQAHSGSKASISRAMSAVAKADMLGGIEGKRVKSLTLKRDIKTNGLSVTMHFSSEAAVDANVSGLLPGQSLGLKKTNEIEYELAFVFNPQTGFYELKDKGTFTLDSDLSGTLSGNTDIFHKVAGAGIKPIIEFSPGQELAEFGANASGIIDISPIVNLVSTYPAIKSADLQQAVVATVESFDVDTLVSAIAAQTLPLKIKFYRIGGFASKISGGSDSVLKGELNAAVTWNDYGNTLDLTSIPVSDYATVIFGPDGLVTSVENLVNTVKDAYQDVSTIN